MTLKALIFDVDGTLADTEEAHRLAFNDAFAEAGLNWVWDRDDYKRLLKTTGGKERVTAFLLECGAAEENISADWVAALHRAKTARYVELVAGGAAALRPGVADLIAQAGAAGVRVAVATTTSRANVDALCQAAWGRAADAVFEALACGDEVAAKKPAPDVFELALTRLGLAPADCIALEDSRNGLMSAVAAGLRTVVTPGFWTDGDRFDEAAMVIPDLTHFDLNAPLPVSPTIKENA